MSLSSSTRTAPARLASLAIAVVLTMAAAACGSSSHIDRDLQATTARRRQADSGRLARRGHPHRDARLEPGVQRVGRHRQPRGLDRPRAAGHPRRRQRGQAVAGHQLDRQLGLHQVGRSTCAAACSSRTARRSTPQAVVDNFDAYLASPFYTLTLGPIFKGTKALDNMTVADRLQAVVRRLPELSSTARPPT